MPSKEEETTVKLHVQGSESQVAKVEVAGAGEMIMYYKT
jgi:hypothetical protein